MITTILRASLLLALFSGPVCAAELTPWGSPEGVKRLERSTAKVDFFPLANHFESQENKIFCGLASAAIVLNTLRLENPAITKPQDTALVNQSERRYLPKGFNPVFERYTQRNVLTPNTKTRMEILGKPIKINNKTMSDYGLQLNQLAAILTANGLNVTTRVADAQLPSTTIKRELIANLKTSKDYVLVNYSRKVLGQGDIGHISPLGAYDEASDSFLVMDVNPNTAGWVWVNAADLIAAMQSFDTVQNRGYLLVKE